MFGYIRPLKPELKIKEFEVYNSVYCGLCRQLGRSFGVFARFTLSYDFAFLALLHMAVEPACPSFKKCACFANPLKKRMCCTDEAALSFSADAAAVSMYYKVLDNIADGRWWEKALWTLLRPFAGAARRRAVRRRPELDTVFSGMMSAQAAAESAGAGLDEAAEPTAAAMAKVFTMLCSGEDGAQRRVLERMGYLTGRYIYLCDACDDLADDIKKRRFNPLKGSPEAAEAAKGAIYLTIAELQAAFALLETQRYFEILDNIFSMGLKAKADRLLDDSDEKRRVH